MYQNIDAVATHQQGCPDRLHVIRWTYGEELMKFGKQISALGLVMYFLFHAGVTQAANFMTRDHLVIDLRHGVEWLRCSVGQTWNGESCEGQILTLNHEQIKVAIKQANEQIGDGWRLPTRAELEGLICTKCGPPMIDADTFPNTAGEPYWTGEVNSRATRHVFSVNFLNGWTYGRFFPTQSLAVRLVRDRR